MSLNESIVEDAALEWFGEQSRVAPSLIPAFSQGEKESVGHGPHLAPGEPAAERDSFSEVLQSRSARTLTRPLPLGEVKREAIRRLNPAMPEEARATIGQYRRVQISAKRETTP
jgi:type I restriction enzyme R subunit